MLPIHGLHVLLLLQGAKKGLRVSEDHSCPHDACLSASSILACMIHACPHACFHGPCLPACLLAGHCATAFPGSTHRHAARFDPPNHGVGYSYDRFCWRLKGSPRFVFFCLVYKCVEGCRNTLTVVICPAGASRFYKVCEGIACGQKTLQLSCARKNLP
eukprot:52649-Pelagomonas_calceolata.AAC.2